MQTAKFYDHAKNHLKPAVAEAIARARREVIAENKAYRVEFTSSEGQRLYWDGAYYDVLLLAKELAWNRGSPVMTDFRGEKIDIAGTRF
jgi:hypothetical protein